MNKYIFLDNTECKLNTAIECHNENLIVFDNT